MEFLSQVIVLDLPLTLGLKDTHVKNKRFSYDLPLLNPYSSSMTSIYFKVEVSLPNFPKNCTHFPKNGTQFPQKWYTISPETALNFPMKG